MLPKINPEEFRLTDDKRVQKSIKTSTQPFLKGPIPLNWLSKSAHLGGKALHVSLALWLLVGLTRSKTVKLSRWALTVFGIGRRGVYSGLNKLEGVGLVSVERKSGCRPVVTILDQNKDTAG